ncbi:A/G-specific adenine glycosylase [Sporolactobacillus shoreicorticis]|uniref:Adenine DNA glycosylase n=1 Tax=Sporolactobacillus shoreicorticis TaxID=1923877 RepID=A0ABW5S2Z0_9BACL|nr:A/G-specific adenine glycosylase [Sporolactobacillus shoreicorticis]MCO7125791.1 A/G-specific adenine glycosylase [Sporolactobacillus shoreicorticis]
MNAQQIRQFNHDLLDWFHTRGRRLPWRETTNPYYIWISEVMLQQTQVNTVIPYYNQFISRFPTPDALAEAPEQEVLKCWEGLGYYSRARNLQHGVREVVEKYDGRLPKQKDELLSITGIGPYTAAALLSIAYNEPEPAIDGNLMRVLSRVFLIDDDIAKQKTRKKFEKLASDLIIETEPAAFNQALMDIGATICRPKNTDCSECPIQRYCLAYDEGAQLEYPVKSGKSKPRLLHYAVLLIQDEQGRYLIERRPDKGLLAGLWQFPMMAIDEYETGPRQESYVQDRYGCMVSPVEQSFSYTHRFSHLIWKLTIREGQGPVRKKLKERQRWSALSELENYPFPVSHQKVTEWIKNNRHNHT